MATSSSTRDVVLSLLEALSSGDADRIAGLFADHVDWHVGGNNQLAWTGSRNSKAEVAEYFRTLWPALTPGKSSTDLDKVIVEGDDAVVLATFHHTAEPTGVAFTTPVAMHVAVESGRIAELHLHEDTWVVSEAFFPSSRTGS
jgi:ketosteroid isomerase-like protein